MTGLDLSTAAGVLRFAELRRAEMRNLFEARGRYECNGFSFGGFVFATHAIARPPGEPPGEDPLEHWKTGRKLPAVGAEPVQLFTWVFDILPPEKHTQLFSHVVRSYAQMTRAIGSLMMTECWLAHATKVPGETREQARDKLPRNLEHAPERQEALLMLLEHAALGERRSWRATIERDPTRVGEWENYEMTDMTGRLVNLTSFRS